MGELLSYSIVSGLSMLAMYLAYRLFLARENQHGFNRGVLLGIYLVSFLSPAIFLGLENLTLRQLSGELTFEAVGNAEALVAAQSAPVWGTVMIWIYIAGMAAVAVRTAVVWIRLSNVIRSGEKIAVDGYTLVVTDSDSFAPFSWMGYVVICRADYESNCRAIMTHELRHVALHHWIDLLLAQTVCIVNWFNPAAWLMRDELMLVHEYQADMAVIDRGHDPQEYQMVLIKKAVGRRFPSLANSLNHSKLKKRITMMYQKKSGGRRRLKALALVPTLAIALGVAAVPAVRAAVTTIAASNVSAGESSKNQADDKISIQRYKVTNVNNNGDKTTIVIKGENLGDNLTVSGGTYTDRGKTYRASSLQCEMTDGNAVITATFPFLDEFDKPEMTLTVNGKEIPFDLENFFASAKTVTVNSETDGKMTILLDGKKIGEMEMNALPPESIVSMTVDKGKNTIYISTKK